MKAKEQVVKLRHTPFYWLCFLRKMGGLEICLLIIYLKISALAALTDPNDFGALSGVRSDWQNTPPNWMGSDPCGNGWEGIKCTNSRVTSIVLSGMGLSGTLSGDIGNFQELQTLDLSQNRGLTGSLPASIGNLKNLQNLFLIGCGFLGQIPGTIGNLKQLVSLSVASNNFTGPVPASIGSLTNLYLLDVTDNKLNGNIPVSDGSSPGLDQLVNARHFHFGQNQLTGTIPPKLFHSNMQLIHVLFDSNQLDGSIPTTMQLLPHLEVLRLDRNSLSGSILLNFTSLKNISQIYLSNNRFTGAIPDLSGMNLLSYLDMSNNSFATSFIPSWFSSLQSLISLIMENTRLQGSIPSALFSVAQLQSVVLSNNHLNGTLDIGTNYGSQLQYIDLQNNFITAFVHGVGSYNKELLLQGNPFCKSTGSAENYCMVPQQSNSSYAIPAENCLSIACNSKQVLSPNCQCAYPITGTMHFRFILFVTGFGNSSYYTSLNASIMHAFQSNKLPVDSISVMDVNDYLNFRLAIFPSGATRFNRTGISLIINQLDLGPFYFTLDNGDYFAEANKSSDTGIIIGAAVGSSILVLLLLMAGFYAFHRRKKAKRATQLSNPFASWDQNESNGSRPQIKGVRCFSFEELSKCTNGFSDAKVIGSGGYGQVYKGTLTNGVVAAIKRAKQGSKPGSLEFKTEIELLSRVHHRNLVNLLGFCYEQGEQMLVYEYITNGTLKDAISGKSGVQLNWMNRLRIALESARGLAYLHELANPSIIHRDVKSNNILLDEHLVAKVADFGLSKPLGENEGRVITQVKGTLGYMDPEYFLTEQLTDKSDVYSFGVVMLELISGRSPLEHGRYIVREVRTAMDKTKDLYGLDNILDPGIGQSKSNLKGLEKFVDVALWCVQELRDNRPTMSEVVKEVENIIELVNLHVNTKEIVQRAFVN